MAPVTVTYASGATVARGGRDLGGGRDERAGLLARRRLAYTRGQTAMADALLMDRMFQRIMRGLVDTGRAPHYAELARALGLGVEEGRLLLHDVMRAYPIGRLHPDTDCIASFPPFRQGR